MAGKGKVMKSGTMTPVRGGSSGKVGKQGGAPRSQPGVVTSSGNMSGSGKWAKGGPSGKVGGKTSSRKSQPGKVTVTGGK